MTMRRGRVFDLEFFRKRYSGRLAAILTESDGTDVAYVHPDGSVQWTQYESLYLDDENAQYDVATAQAMVMNTNMLYA